MEKNTLYLFVYVFESIFVFVSIFVSVLCLYLYQFTYLYLYSWLRLRAQLLPFCLFVRAGGNNDFSSSRRVIKRSTIVGLSLAGWLAGQRGRDCCCQFCEKKLRWQQRWTLDRRCSSNEGGCVVEEKEGREL